ncbi:MAG TPA: hypothetical protein VD789_14200 [Thermomicrobiales bacterium]|nr:hypothetical protein [Thermomicrobiales bacterium]
MKQLAMISYCITTLGILLVAASVATDLSPLWMLSGILLIIAGVVKIAVVQIWQRIAGL